MNISDININDISNQIIKDILYSVEKEEYDKADFLVIYGCHIKIFLDERLNYALSVLKEKKINKIVLTGGVGMNGNFNESEYMYNFLINNGISKDRIIIDNQSKDTEENNINVIELLGLNNTNEHIDIVLISEEFHLARIKLHLNKLINKSYIHFYYDYVENSLLDYDKVINDSYLLDLMKKQIIKIKNFIINGIYNDKKI